MQRLVEVLSPICVHSGVAANGKRHLSVLRFGGRQQDYWLLFSPAGLSNLAVNFSLNWCVASMLASHLLWWGSVEFTFADSHFFPVSVDCFWQGFTLRCQLLFEHRVGRHFLYHRSFPTRLLNIVSVRMVISLLHTDLIGWYAGPGNWLDRFAWDSG
jgi:hypothetical protein